MKKDIYFIINPNSGTKNNKGVATKIKQFFKGKSEEITIIHTEYAGHAKEITEDIINNSGYAVVAVGGDGTLNEVASKLAGKSTRLGIIPTGSGNGFARYLGIPMTIEGALKVIESGHTRKVDTATVNDHFFVNVAGVGFDGSVSRAFEKTPVRGFWSYVGCIITEITHFKRAGVHIMSENFQYEGKPFIVAFSNGTQYGNNALIAPSAKVDDGLLNITIIDDFSAMDIPALATSLLSGRLENLDYVKTFRTKEMKLEIVEHTMDLHVDGEYVGVDQNLDVRLLKEKVSVITEN